MALLLHPLQMARVYSSSTKRLNGHLDESTIIPMVVEEIGIHFHPRPHLVVPIISIAPRITQVNTLPNGLQAGHIVLIKAGRIHHWHTTIIRTIPAPYNDRTIWNGVDRMTGRMTVVKTGMVRLQDLLSLHWEVNRNDQRAKMVVQSHPLDFI